jgi:hypothetical protein
MCTVSAIALPAGGFRIACNRDELLTRPQALPPAFRRFGDQHAVFPVDLVSDGTWIAVNDAGLAMTLLNCNPPQRSSSAELKTRESRGGLIPSLLHCTSAEQAADLADAIAPFAYPPFRLVLIDREAWAEFKSDGWTLESTSGAFDGAPLLWTSSGLGDALVDHPRRELFDRMIRIADACPLRQDAFHAHQWPARPQISVMMQRSDARTVSQTVIEVQHHAARLTYRASGKEHVRQLRLQQPQLL